MDELVVKAIDDVLGGKDAYCKFLSANDSGETGGHQSGILISKSAKAMLYTENELKENHILKKPGKSNGRMTLLQTVLLHGMKARMSSGSQGSAEDFHCCIPSIPERCLS